MALHVLLLHIILPRVRNRHLMCPALFVCINGLGVLLREMRGAQGGALLQIILGIHASEAAVAAGWHMIMGNFARQVGRALSCPTLLEAVVGAFHSSCMGGKHGYLVGPKHGSCGAKLAWCIVAQGMGGSLEAKAWSAGNC